MGWTIFYIILLAAYALSWVYSIYHTTRRARNNYTPFGIGSASDGFSSVRCKKSSLKVLLFFFKSSR